MADKESTVYIIDVGLSMGADHDLVMQYVWDKITSAVCTGARLLTTLPQLSSTSHLRNLLSRHTHEGATDPDLGRDGTQNGHRRGDWTQDRW